MANQDEIKGKFSVALGLTDYVNPILYALTCLIIITNRDKILSQPWTVVYIIGAALSIVFGLAIPTVKLLVGLGKMAFKLPVAFVVCVNCGIFLSGAALLACVFSLGPWVPVVILLAAAALLAGVYVMTGKFNHVAVLIGAAGYLMIYISLIAFSLRFNLVTPVLMYSLAILLYLMLIGIGLKGDLKNARVHWVIEISNILCQAMVAFGTLVLMTNIA